MWKTTLAELRLRHRLHDEQCVLILTFLFWVYMQSLAAQDNFESIHRNRRVPVDVADPSQQESKKSVRVRFFKCRCKMWIYIKSVAYIFCTPNSNGNAVELYFDSFTLSIIYKQKCT